MPRAAYRRKSNFFPPRLNRTARQHWRLSHSLSLSLSLSLCRFYIMRWRTERRGRNLFHSSPIKSIVWRFAAGSLIYWGTEVGERGGTRWETRQDKRREGDSRDEEKHGGWDRKKEMSRFERNTAGPTSFDWTPLVEVKRYCRRADAENALATALSISRRERNNEITLGASFIKFTSSAERRHLSRGQIWNSIFRGSAASMLPIRDGISLINTPNYSRPVNIRELALLFLPNPNPRRCFRGVSKFASVFSLTFVALLHARSQVSRKFVLVWQTWPTINVVSPE